MCNYDKIKKMKNSMATELEKSEFEALDAMSAILVQNREVISCCYSDVTLHITPLTKDERILPLKLAIMANPEQDPANSKNFGVRMAKKGESVWPMILEQGGFHSWK